MFQSILIFCSDNDFSILVFISPMILSTAGNISLYCTIILTLGTLLGEYNSNS